MKALDRYLQNKRIARARPFVRKGDVVLDVGCADGEMFEAWRGHIKYGYGVDPSGSIDRRTRDVLFAFQSHFLPDHRTGAIDADTAATLFALLAKYRFEELSKLRERYADLPSRQSNAGSP